MDGVVLMTAGKKIEENIKVTPVASLILPEYDGAYELLVPSVSGVWVFNETIPKNEVRFEGITFTSGGGGNFDTIYVANEKPWALLYSDYSMGKDTITAYDIEADSWDESYRTVDFGTEPQEVSEEFYAWLTANAVKQ